MRQSVIWHTFQPGVLTRGATHTAYYTLVPAYH
jgi:hypothetical protein